MTTKTEITNTLEVLFDALVPACGKAKTEAGEILRAYARLRYRFWNDGDKLGIDYGNETTNAAGRFLAKHSHGNVDVEYALGRMWWNYIDSDYENMLDLLAKGVYDLLESDDALFTNETEDMWDHATKEDTEYEEEDDWYEDEWDEEDW